MDDQRKVDSDEASQQAQQLIAEALTELAKEQVVQKKSRSGFWFGIILAFSVVAFSIFWWVIKPRLFPSPSDATVVEAQPVKIDESQIQYTTKGELKAIKKVIASQYILGDNPFVNVRANIPRIVQFYVSQHSPRAYLSAISATHDEKNMFAFIVSFNYQLVTPNPYPKTPTPNLLQGLPEKEGQYSFQWRVNALSEANIDAYNDYAKDSLKYYESVVSNLVGTP